MFRVLFVVMVWLSSVWAYSPNHVWYVGTVDENTSTIYFESLSGKYSFENMWIPSPTPNTGYISLQVTSVGRSAYAHMAGKIGDVMYGPVIVVYTYTNSSEWHSISEINLDELANGQNEREIKSGFTASPYVLLEETLTNGDKAIYYAIPDLSNSTKRIRITTCPTSVSTPANNSKIWCQTTFAFIKGTADD